MDVLITNRPRRHELEGSDIAMMGVLAMIAVAVSHIDAWRIPVCSDVSARIQLAPSLRLS